MYKSYTEAPYLAPVFTNKPITMTLLGPEVNPRDKFLWPNVSLQCFFFFRNATKAKAQAGALAYV